MRQRVALVRTLLEDKPIILMDEPFSALDAITRFNLQSLAAHLLKDRTVFLVTHDLDTLYAICDRIAVLSSRRVLVADRIEAVAAYDDAWIRQYFQGPRGRAASLAALRAHPTQGQP